MNNMNSEKMCVGEARQSLPQEVEKTNSMLAECIDIAGDILLTLKQKEKIGSPGRSPGCFLEALEITQLNARVLHDELIEIAFAFGYE